jgi:septum formation protein
MTMNRLQLILASSSPRRRDLLREAGYRFEVRPPPIDDRPSRASGPAYRTGRSSDGAAAGAPPGSAPAKPGAHVESLAYLKAMAAVEAYGLADGLVLGADTIVLLGDRIIGKPSDEADARRILSELSGSEHRVLTGLALVDLARGRRMLAHDVTRVLMRRLAPDQIAAYVAGGEALGKAGAYALQETGDRHIQEVTGSMTNVIGLPMELLERLIKAIGYDPEDFCE